MKKLKLPTEIAIWLFRKRDQTKKIKDVVVNSILNSKRLLISHSYHYDKETNTVNKIQSSQYATNLYINAKKKA